LTPAGSVIDKFVRKPAYAIDSVKSCHAVKFLTGKISTWYWLRTPNQLLLQNWEPKA